MHGIDFFREHSELSVPQTRGGVLEHEAEELRADAQRDLRRLRQVKITLLTWIDRNHAVRRPQFHRPGLT